MNGKMAMKAMLMTALALMLVTLPLLGACTKEVVREVPVERIVEKEVIKEVPVEKVVQKEVIKEVPIEKVVIKEVSLPNSFVIGTLAAGGTTHILGSAIAKIVEKYTDMKVLVQPFPGSKQIVAALNKKEALLAPGLSFLDVHAATRGMGDWTDMGAVGIAASNIAYVHDWVFYVYSGSAIKSIADLRGKKIIIDQPALPVVKLYGMQLLEAYGIQESDITVLKALNPADAYVAFKEKRGNPDALWMTMVAGMADLVATIHPEFLDVDPQKVATLAERYPYHAAGVFPKGKYGVARDVKVLNSPAVVFLRNDADEYLVYTIVKTVFEHHDEFGEIHPAAKDMNLNLVQKYPPPTLYHAGAVRYFKEKGIWTDALEQNQKKQADDLAKYWK